MRFSSIFMTETKNETSHVTFRTKFPSSVFRGRLSQCLHRKTGVYLYPLLNCENTGVVCDTYKDVIEGFGTQVSQDCAN